MIVTYLNNKVALTATIYKTIENYCRIFADNSNVFFSKIFESQDIN